MCVVCKDWELGKLTAKEAFRNLGELINSTEDREERRHLFDLSNQLLDEEVPLNETDEELDAQWHKETHPKED